MTMSLPRLVTSQTLVPVRVSQIYYQYEPNPFAADEDFQAMMESPLASLPLSVHEPNITSDMKFIEEFEFEPVDAVLLKIANQPLTNSMGRSPSRKRKYTLSVESQQKIKAAKNGQDTPTPRVEDKENLQNMNVLKNYSYCNQQVIRGQQQQIDMVQVTPTEQQLLQWPHQTSTHTTMSNCADPSPKQRNETFEITLRHRQKLGGQEISQKISCKVTSINGEPLNGKLWLKKLVIDLIPVQDLCGVDLQSVVVKLEEGAALNSLTQVFQQGYAGFVYLNTPRVEPNKSNKVLILKYNKEQASIEGFFMRDKLCLKTPCEPKEQELPGVGEILQQTGMPIQQSGMFPAQNEGIFQPRQPVPLPKRTQVVERQPTPAEQIVRGHQQRPIASILGHAQQQQQQHQQLSTGQAQMQVPSPEQLRELERQRALIKKSETAIVLKCFLSSKKAKRELLRGQNEV